MLYCKTKVFILILAYSLSININDIIKKIYKCLDLILRGINMNLLVKIALKIISLPIFDMTRDYEIVRRFQDWAAKNEELPPDFVLLMKK